MSQHNRCHTCLDLRYCPTLKTVVSYKNTNKNQTNKENNKENVQEFEIRTNTNLPCFNEHDYPTTIRKQTQQEKNEDFIQLCLTRSTIPPAMHQKDAALISLLQQDKRKIEALDTNIKFNRYWKSMSHKKPKRLIRLL